MGDFAQIRSTYALLHRCGVLEMGEIDWSDFLSIAENIIPADASPSDLLVALNEYQIEHVIRYANLAIFDTSGDISSSDAVAIAGAFARMARHSGAMTDLHLENLSNTQKMRLHFYLGDTPEAVDFNCEANDLPLALMKALTEILNPDPPFAVASIGSLFILTRLNEPQRTELNAAFNGSDVTFELV